MKKKRRFPFWIPICAFLLSFPLFFTALDYKIYDFFLRTIPSLKENPRVWVLTLDDDSVDYGGGFPFHREVMANIVILLKELGAGSITFDLSFLDKSPNRYDESYARKVFDKYLDEGFEEINFTARQIIEEIYSNTPDESDSSFYNMFSGISSQARSHLEDALSYITRDADEYFARALKLTNCSYLTLTMREAENEIPDEELLLILNELALKNINSEKDTKTPEMGGIMPTIPTLLSRAKGAGNVNAIIDSDGVRRRVHLLLKYQGEYYGNLAMAGMLEILGSPVISVSNSEIILNDMRIPRNSDGSVLIKWPKKVFRDYKQESLIKFIQYTFIEPNLAVLLLDMHQQGFFYMYEEGKNPWELYAEAENLKAELLENYSDALQEQWLALRLEYFNSTDSFLFGSYEDQILADLEGDEDTIEFVKERFSVCRSQFGRMKQTREEYANLDGAFCVIGSDATSMTDYGTTPFEENFPNVGTYAALANMFLSREFLSEAPAIVSFLIALIFSFGIAFVSSRFSSWRSIVLGLCVLLLLFVILLAWFQITKQYIGTAIPLVSSALSFAAIIVINFLGANREKVFLHSAFSRYLSPQVINEIISDPSKLNLGGEKREMTVMFTDIQGFSTFSEKLDPTQLVRLLNKYLTVMSNIIMENKGTVDKYEGDAIIAFFGAPLHQKDHADLACRSAIAMKKAETAINKEVMEEGLCPIPIFTRIGINTGEMVVGNMGSENKMDYTVMGNAVNLAARLEGVNKPYKTKGILISEYTHEKLSDEFFCRKLDKIRVVGINTPLRIYELIGIKNEMS